MYKSTVGRAQWYDVNGINKQPLVIGVTGGVYSGKLDLCREIVKQLGISWGTIIHQSSFFFPEKASQPDFNMETPDSIDFVTMANTLKALKNGESAKVTEFDPRLGKFAPAAEIYGADVILCVGTMLFCDKEICDLTDIKIYVDSEDDERLMNCLRSESKFRTVPQILALYEKNARPAYSLYVANKRKFCDIVISAIRSNHAKIAIELLVSKIEREAQARGWVLRPSPHSPTSALPQNVHILTQTPQLTAIGTLLRDVATLQNKFVFYADRLMTHVLEAVLALFPYKDKSVTTQGEKVFVGKELACNLTSIAVNTSGTAFESVLRGISRDACCGRVIIRNNNKCPILLYSNIPRSHMKENYVIIMAAELCTGSTLIMVIKLMLDQGTSEDHIIVATLLASSSGLVEVCRVFPKVSIVCGQVDMRELNKELYIPCSFGNFTKRYFGSEALLYQEDQPQ